MLQHPWLAEPVPALEEIEAEMSRRFKGIEGLVEAAAAPASNQRGIVRIDVTEAVGNTAGLSVNEIKQAAYDLLQRCVRQVGLNVAMNPTDFEVDLIQRSISVWFSTGVEMVTKIIAVMLPPLAEYTYVLWLSLLVCRLLDQRRSNFLQVALADRYLGSMDAIRAAVCCKYGLFAVCCETLTLSDVVQC